MRSNTSLKLLATFVATVALATTASLAKAAPVTYTIDPLLSSLALTGSVNATPLGLGSGSLGAQTGKPASRTAFFQGTIAGDLVAGVVSFLGGSNIDALQNADTVPPPPDGPFIPLLGSVDPGPDTSDTIPLTGEDNFGTRTSLVFGGVVLESALRDFMLDLTGGSLTDGAIPVGISTVITSGRQDTRIVVAPGLISPTDPGDIDFDTTSLVGQTDLSVPTVVASLTTAGLIETIKIPIKTTHIDSGSSGTVTTVLTGQIVATRTVPEPSTLALAGLGLVGLALAWRKNRR